MRRARRTRAVRLAGSATWAAAGTMPPAYGVETTARMTASRTSTWQRHHG